MITYLPMTIEWLLSFMGVQIEPQFSITKAQGRSLAALSQHMRSAGSIWATMDPDPNPPVPPYAGSIPFRSLIGLLCGFTQSLPLYIRSTFRIFLQWRRETKVLQSKFWRRATEYFSSIKTLLCAIWFLKLNPNDIWSKNLKVRYSFFQNLFDTYALK